MTYLIDTHVLLWYMWDDPRLSDKIKREIENQENTILISKASLWEIAIKMSIDKLKLTMPIVEMENYLDKKSMVLVDFSFKDLDILSKLPFHHNDPFDRLIISQAIHRALTIITDDTKFKSYPVQLL